MKRILASALILISAAAFARAAELSEAEFLSKLNDLPKPQAPCASFVAMGAALPKVGPDAGWDEVRATYRPHFPMIAFGTTFITIDGVCVEGDRLRTISPVEECLRYAGKSRTCVEKRSGYLRTPVVYQDRECVRRDSFPRKGFDSCREYREVTRRRELSPMVSVGKRELRKGESPFAEVFQKRYDIPACR